MSVNEVEEYPRVLKKKAIQNGKSMGLTKREEIAAMAMQGLLSTPDEASLKANAETIARWAVEHAEALLFELEKK
jgi:hypothetical protein